MRPREILRPGASAALLGAFSLLAQTLLARELLVLFHGSELTLGLVFGSWLLWTGAGSALAPRLLERPALAAAAGTALPAAAALALPASVLGARAVRLWFSTGLGLVPGLAETAAASAALLAPQCLLCGAWFTLAASRGRAGAAGPGRAYAWEAVGGLAAGVLFTFLFAGRWDGLALGAATAAALLAAVAADLFAGSRETRPPRAAGVAAAAGAVLTAAVALSPLPARSQGWRWPGLTLAAATDSRYANLALIRQGAQHSLFENGWPAFSFPDPESAETAAHLPALAAPRTGRVLVAGGCAGGVLAEVLKHPVREADCLELDPAVLRLVRPRLPPSLAAALDDPRVRLREADLRAWLAAPRDAYDLILLAAPEPASAMANRVLTLEFLRLARRALAPGGTLALTVSSSPNYLGPRLLARNATLWHTLRAVFPAATVLPVDSQILFLASPGGAVSADPQRLASRMRERGVDSTHLKAAALPSLLSAERAAALEEALSRVPAQVNRDLAPVAYFHHTLFWAALNDPGLAPWVARVLTGGTWWLFALPLILFAVAAAHARLRRGPSALPLDVAAISSGWAAMSLQCLVLFGYQTQRGILFSRLGLLSGTFMGGLAAGAFLSLRAAAGRPERRRPLLLGADAALLALAGVFGGVLLLFSGGRAELHPAASDIGYALSAALAGAAVGFQFPLFALSQPDAESAPARAAGRYYLLDLTGSALGALCTTVWLLPALGVGPTLAFLAALKAASLAALLLPVGAATH